MKSYLPLVVLGLWSIGMFGCPTAGDGANDDFASADDDDVSGDDDDDSAGADDDDSGDDGGPVGACVYFDGIDLVACEVIPESNCDGGGKGGPAGITVEWSEEACPAGSTAMCVSEHGDWFYYLDQNSAIYPKWCQACVSGLVPPDYCDDAGGIGGAGGSGR